MRAEFWASRRSSDSSRAVFGWPFAFLGLDRVWSNLLRNLHLVRTKKNREEQTSVTGGESRRFNDYPDYAVCQKLPKFNVSLCRKNGSDRDLIELPGIAILRPFRSGIQVRIPEIIGSWVRRRRAKVDVRLVARSAVCAPEFDIVRVSRLREPIAPAFR